MRTLPIRDLLSALCILLDEKDATELNRLMMPFSSDDGSLEGGIEGLIYTRPMLGSY